MNTKLEEEYIKKLNEWIGADEELGHIMADSLICDLLMKLGYKKVIEEYEKIDKWNS